MRFLIGPAGSGKTFRCLAEVRAALERQPDGDPLVILAPKQATFQIERQLLADGKLSGFTRLSILSFDRLAQFIFDRLNLSPPKLLSGEGRLMVLRALLHRHADGLRLFSGSARRGGFAQELAALLSELQQHHFGPAKLRSLAANEKLRRELRDKLHDLALLSEKYADWLREHDLQDADCLLEVATDALRKESKIKNSKLKIAALWLDGFAEMTPQELALLAAVVPFCESPTLAFCLETEPTSTQSWLSIWSAIGKTFQNCRQQLATIEGIQIKTEVLKRVAGKSRFAPDSALATLEEDWTLPIGQPATFNLQPSTIHVTACTNPEAEAIFAAREVLKFVRDGRNRFRDCAILVRNLDTHYQPLARACRRYGIPFFLDRRENVAHHPLAELTRNALRTVAGDWQHDDWFAALKCGFLPVDEHAIDDLENRALEFGWRGKQWREPLPDEFCEQLRQVVIPPFERFYARLVRNKFAPTGQELAAALRGLWKDLDVENILAHWEEDSSNHPPHSNVKTLGAFPLLPGGEGRDEGERHTNFRLMGRTASPHHTVWEQMNVWLDNLELAFPRERLGLRDWLPVLEAGLGNLTVGVIPPSLDEVLVGAIDRARNPDLKFALLLGVNESVFPVPPATPVLLTNADRAELDSQNAGLGSGPLDQISRERYLGYIACTRANEKLTLSFSRQSTDGKTLNPSPFIGQIQKIFPGLPVEEFSEVQNPAAAEHANELIPELVHHRKVPDIPVLNSLAKSLASLREPDEKENLSPAVAERLYGPVLRSSVSRLEQFASCPFKFFVHSGLRANERKTFELDARERGNFQHDVLQKFHEQLQAENKRWRDLEPAAARARIKKIADAGMEHFGKGILRHSPETVFAARAMAAALQDFIEIITGWMRGQYEFDPARAEFDFGSQAAPETAWTLDLPGGHQLVLQGRIDRLDLWRNPENDSALVVVTDYKSGGKKLEPLFVENGVQLQLLAYLGTLRHWKNPQAAFGVKKLVPAGAFYVSLRGKFEGGDSREEILADAEAKKMAYRHNGRFDAGWLRKFDRRPGATGDQFNFRLNKDGKLSSKSADALPREDFEALLDGVETTLRTLGQKIFSGAAQVDPYRKGAETPCKYCDYQAVCRIDDWTHEFRELKSSSSSSSSS